MAPATGAQGPGSVPLTRGGLSTASLAPGSSSLSWGWVAALTSAWGHVATGALVAREAARQQTRRRHSENFLRGLQQQQQQQAAPSIVV